MVRPLVWVSWSWKSVVRQMQKRKCPLKNREIEKGKETV